MKLKDALLVLLSLAEIRANGPEPEGDPIYVGRAAMVSSVHRLSMEINLAPIQKELDKFETSFQQLINASVEIYE